jgi:transcriptional regulator with XRE-family HTH domain
MINNSEFATRLKKVLEYYQLSASAFAEKINVQRSSISHLLSGRNKPSLDFVLKVLDKFKDVELYWLLNGKGVFPKTNDSKEFPTTLFSEKPTESQNISKDNTSEKIKTIEDSPQIKTIERIVIFYTDGTFKNYHED